MSTPSIQLDLETALAAYITSLNLFAIDIHPAHQRDKIASGDYLGIIADLPDWETLTVNAIVPVTFELATAGVQDHDKAGALSITHSVRVGAIIELFSLQNYPAALAAFNDPLASWRGIGLTGWDAQPPVPDGTSPDGTQLVARLPYEFEAFLES